MTTNSKERELQRLREEFDSLKTKMQETEKKIKRLKKSRIAVMELKKEFKEKVKRPSEDCRDKTDRWEGSTFDSFRKKEDKAIAKEKDYYKYALDFANDSINDEITRLQRERSENFGVLGKINSNILAIKNEIENVIN